MSGIDWSKAPEWATRYCIVGVTSSPVWANENQYEYLGGYQKGHIFEIGIDGFPESRLVTIEQRPSNWTGTGLPPVGIECEANMPPNAMRKEYEWRRVKVVHSGIPGAEREVLVYDLENTYPAWVDEFRPLRTPEQIAAEERQKSIEKMISSIHPGIRQVAIVNSAYGYLKEACADLHDAGYRKTEAP